MIKIINTGKKKEGKVKYDLFINKDYKLSFWHKWENGLGACLLEASKEVERKKWMQLKDMFS